VTVNFSTLYKCFLTKFHLPKALLSPAMAPEMMTQKYRGYIVVLSIIKSVEPNKEHKEITSGFQQGILCKH